MTGSWASCTWPNFRKSALSWSSSACCGAPDASPAPRPAPRTRSAPASPRSHSGVTPRGVPHGGGTGGSANRGSPRSSASRAARAGDSRLRSTAGMSQRLQVHTVTRADQSWCTRPLVSLELSLALLCCTGTYTVTSTTTTTNLNILIGMSHRLQVHAVARADRIRPHERCNERRSDWMACLSQMIMGRLSLCETHR